MPRARPPHARARPGPGAGAAAAPGGLQKAAGAGARDEGDTEAAHKFRLELCWCVQQLEKSLASKQLNEKQLQDSWKVLQVLKNNNQPVIRKRQLMRTHFGEYRAKMAAEEKKLVKMTSAVKITDPPENPKATFLRKSAFLTTGDDSFKFNFDLKPEHLEDSTARQDVETCGRKVPDCAEEVLRNVDPKSFKFSFTNAPFKFNFRENEV